MALLRKGSTGPEVRWLQTRLNEIAEATGDSRVSAGAVDGVFGRSTEAAVIAFQRARDLAVDGVVGASTLAELSEAAASGAGPAPLERRPLDHEARERLIDIISRFEGSYWTLNLDGEFEGLFDKPSRDAAGRWISPERRSEQPGFTPLSWSKFGEDPGHVGLSFGFVQFTQDGGNLGRLLRAMQDTDPDLFREQFGPLADELVRVTNLPGKRVDLPDASSPTGRARRSPRVTPIGGAELWHSPWKERFVKAGKEPAFQSVQRRLADSLYFSSMLTQCAVPFRVTSEKGLCALLDRAIQMGPGGAAKLLSREWTGKLDWPEPRRFEHLYTRVRTKFWSHRLRKILDSDDTSFLVEYDFGVAPT